MSALLNGFWLLFYNFLIVSTCIGAAIFTIGHGTRYRWWETVNGQNVFCFGLVITLTFAFLSLRIVFPEFPGRLTISFILVICLFVVVWWRTILWFIGEFRRVKGKRKDRTKP